MKRESNGSGFADWDASTHLRWSGLWKEECPAGFWDDFCHAELTYGLPPKWKQTEAGAVAREIALRWFAAPKAKRVERWEQVASGRPARRVAKSDFSPWIFADVEGAILDSLDRHNSDVFRALADYLDQMTQDGMLALTERLLNYAYVNRGKPIHTARQIQEMFAPKLKMRRSEWVEFLRVRKIPYLPGRRGRPRKNGKIDG